MSDGMNLVLYIVFWPFYVIYDYSQAWRKALRGIYVDEPLEAVSAGCGVLELLIACVVVVLFFAHDDSGWWFVLPGIGWIVLGLIAFFAQIGMIEESRDAYE